MSPHQRSMARSPADHSARSREGGLKGAAVRRAEKAEGMAFARAWREAHRHVDWEAIVLAEAGLPVPPHAVRTHMPFKGHRTQAEVGR